VTDPEQGKPAAAMGVAAVDGWRAPVLEVLAKLRGGGPQDHEPDRIRTDLKRGLVELEFDSGPTPVVAWAAAMGFPRPINKGNAQLRQTIVMAEGQIAGWRVEIRHVHTAPATLAAAGAAAAALMAAS
jgi:hypothetical protein